MRARGVVIPTAMFLVLVLFGLITAIHMSVQQNFRVTQHGHGQTRARYLAKAAVQSMVAALNSDASLERLHEGEQNAKVTHAADEAELRAWIVVSDVPGVLWVVGQGTTRDGYTERAQGVVRRFTSQGLLYARLKANDRAITFFSIDGAQAASGQGSGGAGTAPQWTMAQPIPTQLAEANGDLADLRENKDDKGDYVGKVRSSAADQQGGLYAVVARDKGDRIVRYDLATKQWTLLPNIPDEVYGRNGKPQTARPDDDVRLEQLASNGSNLLYAVRAHDGVDTVLVYNQNRNDASDASGPPEGWSLLPPVKVNGKEAQGGLQELVADASGRLYARIPESDKDTVVQYDPVRAQRSADHAWKTVNLPRTWLEEQMGESVNWEGDELEAWQAFFNVRLSEPPPNLTYFSASPQGELYAVYSKDGIDTMFRGREKTKKGAGGGDTGVKLNWKMLDPPRKSYYNLDGERVDDSGLSARLRQTAVDANGRLYVRNDRRAVHDKADALFVYPKPRELVVSASGEGTVNPDLSLLPALERKRWRRNNGKDGPTVHEGELDVVMEVPDLIGGGRPNDSGVPEYTVVDTY